MSYDYENNKKYRQKTYQKISWKVREDSVEAIRAISFPLKTLSKICWTSFISQHEISFLGECNKISRETNNKDIQFFFQLWNLVTVKSDNN